MLLRFCSPGRGGPYSAGALGPPAARATCCSSWLTSVSVAVPTLATVLGQTALDTYLSPWLNSL